MKRDTVVEMISALFVFLFIYASVTKLLDYNTFRIQLSKSPFISSFAGIVVWSLPASEFAISTLLFFPKTRLAGLYFSLFLMTFFTAYIYTMLHFSYYLPCSCGGILSKMSWEQHLVFNIFFVVLSIAGIYLKTNSRLPVKILYAKKEPISY